MNVGKFYVDWMEKFQSNFGAFLCNYSVLRVPVILIYVYEAKLYLTWFQLV